MYTQGWVISNLLCCKLAQALPELFISTYLIPCSLVILQHVRLMLYLSCA